MIPCRSSGSAELRPSRVIAARRRTTAGHVHNSRVADIHREIPRRFPTTSIPSEWNAARIAQCEELLGAAVCRRMAIYALPDGFVLTVLAPIYNEVDTIDGLVSRLLGTGLPLQIILVDDGSGDVTAENLAALAKSSAIRVICHPVSRGKGAAIRTGSESARGDVIVIQDADRDYDPEDLRYLLQTLLEGRADVVYGTRYGHSDHQVSPLWHAWVNGLLT